jgi:putative Mg2+ transporter-C (MgtC) family protein
MDGQIAGEMLLRLVIALGLGGLLGLERSYHGRPAGFRTHALVCLASGALMMITVYDWLWFRNEGGNSDVRASIDPTRMAQGIMTGIGFLGAGVIMKQAMSIRGLTTSASIWVTAGIGIMVGVGMYLPAALTTALALGALSGFRWIERRIPNESYAQLTVSFAAAAAPAEPDVIALVKHFGFKARDVTHRFSRGDAVMEYRLYVHTLDPASVTNLTQALRAREDVVGYGLSPAGD